MRRITIALELLDSREADCEELSTEEVVGDYLDLRFSDESDVKVRLISDETKHVKEFYDTDQET